MNLSPAQIGRPLMVYSYNTLEPQDLGAILFPNIRPLKNEHNFYNDFQNHYQNYAYLNNKAIAANQTISKDAYDEDEKIYRHYTPWVGWWTSTKYPYAEKINY